MESFEIRKINSSTPATYTLEDESLEQLEESLFQPELQKSIFDFDWNRKVLDSLTNFHKLKEGPFFTQKEYEIFSKLQSEQKSRLPENFSGTKLRKNCSGLRCSKKLPEKIPYFCVSRNKIYFFLYNRREKKL